MVKSGKSILHLELIHLFLYYLFPIRSFTMKKILALMLVCCSLHADPIFPEFKIGYFRFSDHKLREVYDNSKLDLQLALSWPIWEHINAYGAIEYIGGEGRSLGGHNKTTLTIVPMSLGVKYVIPIATDEFDYYFTVGPRYYFVHQNNHGPVDHNLNRNGLGGFVGTGFIYHFSDSLGIDAFAEYSYKRFHFESSKQNISGHALQVGGIALGGGLGYFF